MSYEQGESHSGGYGFQEGWEIAELVGEIPPFPLVILGDLIEDTFGNFTSD